MPSNHLILCHPLLLPSIFPSIRVFSKEVALHIRWATCWSFSFSISPSNEYSELISFRTHWFHLLAIQGTPKNLLQHHSLKASVLWHSAFLMVQLSHSYMTTGKTIVLTIWTFFGKVMSLLFNTLSRFIMPGKSHGWRSLVGCSPWGRWRVGHSWVTSLSCIGEGNVNPLQCSCLENPRDGGAWWAAVYGVTQSQTQLKWLTSSS